MTTAKEINRVILYGRTSKEDTGTLETMVKEGLDSIKSQDLTLVEPPYIEEASATNLEGRPVFQDVLERISLGDIDAVIGADWDRMSRTENLREEGHIKECLRESDTAFMDYKGMVLDFSEMTGRIVGGVQSEISTEENKRRNRRTKRTKKAALELGIYRQNGYRGYGYRTISGNRATKTPPRTVQRKAEATILREAYRLMMDESYSATKVTVRWNERGIKTRHGRDWRPNTLCAIIRNTSLYGEIIANRWVAVKNEKTGKKNMVERPREEWKIAYIQDPIFTKAEWEHWNKILDVNSNTGRPAQLKGKYLCRGLLKCEICGSTYTTYNGGKGNSHKKYYYACPNRRIPKKKLINNAVACKFSPLVRQELLDWVVWTDICKMLVWPEEVLEAWFRPPEPQLVDEDERELAQIDREIEGYNGRIRNLLDIGEELGTEEPEYDHVKNKVRHYRALIGSLRDKARRVKERRALAEAQKAKEQHAREGIYRLLETLESKVEIRETDGEGRNFFKRTRVKREILWEALMALDFGAKRELLEAIVGDEKILIRAGEGAKFKPSWSQRSLKADFHVSFQGILDVDRVINILKSIDKEVYLKAYDVAWYR